MQKIIIFIILLAIVGCKKDNKDNDSIDPIFKDTSIIYPENVNGVLNLLGLNSGTKVKPDTTYSISAIIGKDAILKITFTDPSHSEISKWDFDEESNTGWTISTNEKGQQQLISSDTGLININIKFNNTGYCNIQQFENQPDNADYNIQLSWKTIKFILAGVIDSSNYYYYNHFMLSDFEYFINVNMDDKPDFLFIVEWDHLLGEDYSEYTATVAELSNFEILADTTMKFKYGYNEDPPIEVDTIPSKIYMPKLLNYKDSITPDGNWLKDTKLTFSNYGRNVPCSGYKYMEFPGWNDHGIKFMGYRCFSHGDTLYGWVGIKIDHYYQILIRDASYKSF